MTAQSPTHQMTAEEAMLLLFVPMSQAVGRPLRVLDIYVALLRAFEQEAFFPKAFDELLRPCENNPVVIFNLLGALRYVGLLYSEEGYAYQVSIPGMQIAAGVRDRMGYSYEEIESMVAGLIPVRVGENVDTDPRACPFCGIIRHR